MPKLGHIGIIANDPKNLAEWYRDILGFEIILEMKKKGRLPIYFLKGEEGSYIEILPPSFKNHIGFVVDHFDEAVKTLKTKGIVFEIIRETSMGWKIAYFQDPEGNQLEIIYRPKPL
jgi:catechol 2,3-dioxygenase-like lactoylglutathione lyase family enzyme